ncbi:hypothetical protein D3C72_2221570 [compost metagenome]
MARPQPTVIRVGQRKSDKPSGVPMLSRVMIGMIMLNARVIRKIPRRKAIRRRVGRAMGRGGLRRR